MTTLITYEFPSAEYTKVEISRAPEAGGSYAIISEVDSPTAYYLDAAGKDYSYYKYRFFNDTSGLWEDYSDEETNVPYNYICEVADIKVYMDTVGKFTDKEIFQQIHEQEEEFIDEIGTPLEATTSETGTDANGDVGDTFYVGEENIYSIDQAFYGTSSPAEIFETENFRTNDKYGMLRVLSVASGGPELTTNASVEIRYVPKLYNTMVKYRTLKIMYEKVDYSDGDELSVKLQIITKRLDAVEKIQMERIGVLLSGSTIYYDPIYGVNTKKITQNYDRNTMLATRGWNA